MFTFITVEFLVTIKTQSRFNPNKIDKKIKFTKFYIKEKVEETDVKTYFYTNNKTIHS